MTSGVIYLMSCTSCGDEYIGETKRLLCSRVLEHLDGLKRSRPDPPPRVVIGYDAMEAWSLR